MEISHILFLIFVEKIGFLTMGFFIYPSLIDNICFCCLCRMESTHRTWLHASKDASGGWNADELRRDLRTALGTTKWQVFLSPSLCVCINF